MVCATLANIESTGRFMIRSSSQKGQLTLTVLKKDKKTFWNFLISPKGGKFGITKDFNFDSLEQLVSLRGGAYCGLVCRVILESALT